MLKYINITRALIAVVSLVGITVLFQNCSPGFKSAGGSLQIPSLNSLGEFDLTNKVDDLNICNGGPYCKHYVNGDTANVQYLCPTANQPIIESQVDHANMSASSTWANAKILFQNYPALSCTSDAAILKYQAMVSYQTTCSLANGTAVKSSNFFIDPADAIPQYASFLSSDINSNHSSQNNCTGEKLYNAADSSTKYTNLVAVSNQVSCDYTSTIAVYGINVPTSISTDDAAKNLMLTSSPHFCRVSIGQYNSAGALVSTANLIAGDSPMISLKSCSVYETGSTFNRMVCNCSVTTPAVTVGGICQKDPAYRIQFNGEVPNFLPAPAPTATPAIQDPISATQARNEVINLYKMVLGRTDAEIAADSSGVNYWVAKRSAGMPLLEIETSFRASDEFFVRAQYQLELHRLADAEGLKYWVDQLARGIKTREQVTLDMRYACSNHVGGECPVTAPPSPNPTGSLSCTPSAPVSGDNIVCTATSNVNVGQLTWWVQYADRSTEAVTVCNGKQTCIWDHVPSAVYVIRLASGPGFSFELANKTVKVTTPNATLSCTPTNPKVGDSVLCTAETTATDLTWEAQRPDGQVVTSSHTPGKSNSYNNVSAGIYTISVFAGTENPNNLMAKTSFTVAAPPPPPPPAPTSSGITACSFNGQTVPHGATIKAFRTSTVPFGASCLAQARTCTNGTLSGSYTYSFCSTSTYPTPPPPPPPPPAPPSSEI